MTRGVALPARCARLDSFQKLGGLLEKTDARLHDHASAQLHDGTTAKSSAQVIALLVGEEQDRKSVV